MFDYHKDKDRYFQMQYLTARDHIIPFVDRVRQVDQKMRVLEVGCGEAGVLLAFLERGCECMGIELHEIRMQKAMAFHDEAVKSGQAFFVNKNIYDIDIGEDCGGKFDLVILKDVIEHIPEQNKLMKHLKTFLKEDGMIFFGFPPWHMPFGGHQQICKNRLLGKLPYYHLLPVPIYRGILKSAGEREAAVKELLELKETGITIERFERITRDAGLKVLESQHFLFNPIYQYKFNLKPRKQFGIVRAVPFVRNFFTTAVYYLVA